MPQSSQLIYTDNPGDVPARFVLPDTLDLVLQSVVARYNGVSAASAFKPCLSLYSQDGRLMGRFFPSKVCQAGDEAVVTFAPFLGGDGGDEPQPFHGASVYSNALQTYPGNNVVTPAIMGVSEWDTDGYWDAGDPTKLTVPPGLGGYYLVQMRDAIAWTGVDTEFDVILLVNGARQTQNSYSVSFSLSLGSSGQPFVSIVHLDAGDYVQLGHSHVVNADRNSPASDRMLQCALIGV